MGILSVLKDKAKAKLRKAEPLPTFPTPLGFRIGAAVDVDTLEFRVLGDKLKMNVPSNTLIIESYGQIKLDSQVTIHRFYAKDAMFQLVTEGSDDNVTEIRLFTEHDIVYPANEDEVNVWVDDVEGLIGDPQFQLQDGTLFDRAIFEDTEGHVEATKLTETIVTNEQGDSYLVDLTSMLYARWVDDDTDMVEWLFVALEDFGEQMHIELLLGIDIDKTTINVI